MADSFTCLYFCLTYIDFGMKSGVVMTTHSSDGQWGHRSVSGKLLFAFAAWPAAKQVCNFISKEYSVPGK